MDPSKSVIVHVEINNSFVSSEIMHEDNHGHRLTPGLTPSITTNSNNTTHSKRQRAPKVAHKKETRSNCFNEAGKSFYQCGKIEERKYFTIQAIIIWCILCLPGNVVTLYFFSRVSLKNSTLTNSSDLSDAQNSIEEVLLIEDQLRSQIMKICKSEFSRFGSEEACLDRFADVGQLSKLCDREGNAFTNCLSRGMHRLFNSSAAFNSSGDSHLQCYESMTTYNPIIKSARFWIQGIAVLSVGIFGLCGNILTIKVLKGTNTNRNFNKLLIALAVVDSLTLFNMIVEVSIIYSLLPPGQSLPFWYIIGYPYFFHPTKGMIQTGSIFMVVAISAERYKAVCHPLSHRHAPSKFIAFVVIISVTLEIPRFFQFRLSSNSTDFYATDFWPTDLMEDPDYIQFSSYWDEMITTGAVPLLALIYFNAKMILKIRASSRFSHRFVGSNHNNSGNKERSSQTRLRSMEMEPLNVNKRKLSCSISGTIAETRALCPNGSTILKSKGSEESPSLRRFSKGTSTIKSSSRRGGSTRFSQNASSKSSGHFQRRREKSTLILVSIVLIFMACHSYRLALKFYEAAHPENNTAEHYRHCQRQNKYHVPVIIYILMNLNHLFVVLNSSTNFIVYCCVGKEFRLKVWEIFCRK